MLITVVGMEYSFVEEKREICRNVSKWKLYYAVFKWQKTRLLILTGKDVLPEDKRVRRKQYLRTENLCCPAVNGLTG